MKYEDYVIFSYELFYILSKQLTIKIDVLFSCIRVVHENVLRLLYLLL